ncbi:MAG: T9SS type A sorting domain-containing protein [Bacteroidetes bacterium]|nr:T9SS type A sorting domain-containing protein [Bacteroidota bacterium]MBU1116937.1 T9SS type A sorting domain-containing protein [Bacteroidota bacterium]MBU1797394.1 T9SS type A sorting domain-containing protein [Bacteroidota bacterium]
MKKTFRLLVIALFVMLFSVKFLAQSHEMYLPIPTEIVYLNEIIKGDTLSTGDRADLERVYVLQRGGTWFYNGVIKNIDWDIRIKAEDGEGAIPLIYGLVEAGGTNVPIDFIDAQGNVYLKNIAVNGIFDVDPDYAAFTYGAPRELIVFNVSGNYTMTVTGCIFENAYQADLRTFAGIRSINVTDCIFANSGTLPWQSISNGRAVDLRNTSCDTLKMVNNTFVNGNDRVVRHIGSTARLNTFIFEHNTVLNNGGRYGVLALGLIGDDVRIKDNLFVDAMALGADTSESRQWDFRENGEPFSDVILDKVNMTMVYSQSEGDSAYATNFDITNNYLYDTQEILDVWAKIKSETGNSTLMTATPLTKFIASKIDNATTTAFIKLENGINFTEAPSPMSEMVYWNLRPAPEGAGEKSNGGTEFRDFDRRTTVYHRDTLDCSYEVSSPAYLGGSDGFPVGDLNWFPSKKADWITDVEAVDGNIPVEFSLEQNYPNPFNPSTLIRFSIPEVSKVTLSVYNLLGQKVASLVNKNMNAGNHEINFNANGLSTGIYFYTINAGNFQSTRKMMLIK